jgi:hypothetical protein
MDLDEDDLEALGFGSQIEALAWSGWAERKLEQARESSKDYSKTLGGRMALRRGWREYVKTSKGAEARRRSQTKYRLSPSGRANRASWRKKKRAALRKVTTPKPPKTKYQNTNRYREAHLAAQKRYLRTKKGRETHRKAQAKYRANRPT